MDAREERRAFFRLWLYSAAVGALFVVVTAGLVGWITQKLALAFVGGGIAFLLSASLLYVRLGLRDMSKTSVPQPSSIDQSVAERLRLAYELGIKRSRAERICLLLALVFFAALFPFGSLATRLWGEDGNFYLGLLFLGTASLIATLGMIELRRDRSFRQTEPQLHREVSLWSFNLGPLDSELRPLYRKAMKEFWLTGRDPKWLGLGGQPKTGIPEKGI